ncbi:MAG: hypothetical protein ACE5GT_15525 [Rhodospirillales bacterium]
MTVFKPSTRLFGALALGLLAAWPGAAGAGKASVLDVVVIANPNGTYTFQVTVAHKDEGWKHYADKFEILGPDGKAIATRVLYHPHVNEQPFTRSLANVNVPLGVTHVTVRAWDTVHKAGTRTFRAKLPPRK